MACACCPMVALSVLRLTYASQGGPRCRCHELVRDYWGAVGVRVDLREVSSDEYRATGHANDADILSWKNDGVSRPGLQPGPAPLPSRPLGDFLQPRPRHCLGRVEENRRRVPSPSRPKTCCACGTWPNA